jgi:hypothetical protein
MARPLRFDDQFISIINEKIEGKFFFLFKIKVQSTAFCKKLNLQQSLRICGIYDLVIGVLIFFNFFKILDLQSSIIFTFEIMFLLIGLFFGILGIDSANNLRKTNAGIYKIWRYFITCAIPVLELSHLGNNFCYFTIQCDFLYYVSVSVIYFLINLYFTKIAWSFFVRLDKGHETLVIHGKHLEKMILDENYKINDVKKYIPPEIRDQNKMKFVQKENELVHFADQGTVVEEQMFAPKQNNLFFNAAAKNISNGKTQK